MYSVSVTEEIRSRQADTLLFVCQYDLKGWERQFCTELVEAIVNWEVV